MSDQPVMKPIDVAAYVETLLPPISEVMQIDSNKAVDDLSPFVPLPAIYVHIIIQGLRAELLGQQHAAMEAAIAKAEMKPKVEMTADKAEALSILLATEATSRSFNPIEGATALWKAAAVVAVAHMPPSNALSALDDVHAMVRADVAQAIGAGVTKQ
ncbi:MAG: hypothetical protein CMN63_06975 [Sphingobium sp.]|nr:hypothetical protein [Sphingobium sp.]